MNFSNQQKKILISSLSFGLITALLVFITACEGRQKPKKGLDFSCEKTDDGKKQRKNDEGECEPIPDDECEEKKFLDKKFCTKDQAKESCEEDQKVFDEDDDECRKPKKESECDFDGFEWKDDDCQRKEEETTKKDDDIEVKVGLFPGEVNSSTLLSLQIQNKDEGIVEMEIDTSNEYIKPSSGDPLSINSVILLKLKDGRKCELADKPLSLDFKKAFKKYQDVAFKCEETE